MTGFAEPGASRDGYGDALLDMAGDERVVVLEADLGKSTKSCHFRAEYPERTFCLGIAEQNMALVGAGLAEAGKVPFASTFAIFSERAFEQFRNGIARTGLVVHLCGSHGGMHTGQDGSSAQSTEDLGIFRTLPEVTVMTPCDRNSSRSLTKKLLDHPRPSYTRTARNKTREIYTKEEAEDLEIGKASVLREGADASIIACGVMVERALEAADRLAERGVEAAVIDMHTIKPIDREAIIRAASSGAIVTAEDHSVIGGLGSAVAEVLVEEAPTMMRMIGVRDKFGESGSPSDIM
ncbi:MAG: transketolase C-terminal domain-containing protein, partial [Candidatus Thermoplasmatota archaeon]|nr:transketolase C-terminal domain-containing protein [Candidatus Thermoplasmatota archaeon]